MMEQYHALKREAGECLLFYRMGDFFELFFDDAKIAAGVLDIALTSRGESGGEAVPMCGVPVHSADGYLARLIRAGHRVAIAEQVETPDEARARAKAEGKPSSKVLVARKIIRFVTAGTLTEDTLLEPRRANQLAALCELRGRVGIAACDISTGRMELEECEADGVAAALSRLGAREIVAPEDWADAPYEAIARAPGDFASERGRKRLEELHGVATLDAFGTFSRAMLAAAGGLLAYLDHAGRGSMPFLLPPTVNETGAVMAIDEASRTSLEITATQNGERAGSLLGTVDRCVTSAGARLLAEDLSAPLARRTAIEARLALVRLFHEDPILRGDTREALRAIPDIARALARLVADRGSPRDLGQVRDGLAQARRLNDALTRLRDHPPLLDELLPQLTGHGALVDELSRALVPSPPTERGNGGFIAAGYDAALDALRETSGNARRAIAAMEARYRSETGISALKIKHNGVLGYFIEVPARHGDALMGPDSGFTHRQTMANAVRFNSVHLHEEASRIAEAGGHALAAEEAHFEALVETVVAARERIAQTADALARIDVAAALAERAAEGDWCAPQIDDAPCLEIVAGRHPVVEAALAKAGERFVPNDCGLAETDRLWLIGGPNMGGKSTFLRANALIVLLAQAGSYVPATSARIGLVDRLFSRVGASDNLARGRSTFMVEMVETAAILARASERSFVILDEIGRGTSTYDGLALAWAVAEAIHENNRCRCLFATHYHELARLAESCDALSLHHVRAREWQGDLVLLHEVAEGPADRSYGLAVAKLAGVPPEVVDRASAVLAKLEKGREETGGLAAGLGDLPLFSAAVQAEQQECDSLRDTLSALDVDALSPREALDMLYQLKREAGES
ncbi:MULTISPECIES: DNA mismatch repair protein MutS [Citromicrobium]|uniref:DNA mismatch repair protein MutS n=1 Tax=Citromicrobium TaxID=72173 RepID=UPI0001DD073D|nr:DNA mismatch repair protein MutS [Citromicrobium sp. JL477]KPM17420.1 DNA mismatch repair protein MutS [Citromicrobium sp. JL1351]KPM20340.1 DNA mismatch repair protein MutS [Citromicrobium sp. JL31]KPM27251.1 DNA mismatch repair protein MutS [Citromicrobium sp. JL2201]